MNFKSVVPALHPYLAPIKPIVYSYAGVHLIIDQDSFHAILLEEYFESDTDPNTLPVAVCFPIGCVLSGPMPTFTGSLSTCFTSNTYDTKLAGQIKCWYEKARLVTMKALSNPKLEQQVALLATHLKEDILKDLTIHVSNTFMQTDSTTVSQWLNSHSKQPTFVANLIG